MIQFSNGRRIYSLSSHPDALAGKRGHVKLDEFALHQDQRLLYSIAKPVTTWGGTLSIMSTHRGAATVFNQIIRDILENDNPMKWSLHTISPLTTTLLADGKLQIVIKFAEKLTEKDTSPGGPPIGTAVQTIQKMTVSSGVGISGHVGHHVVHFTPKITTP